MVDIAVAGDNLVVVDRVVVGDNSVAVAVAGDSFVTVVEGEGIPAGKEIETVIVHSFVSE